MRTPLALLNLLHEKTRLIVAIAGVAFAVLLIFMNLGFLGALTQTTSEIYSKINADIVMISPQTLEISTSKTFPRDRLYQVAGIDGVEQVMPLYVGYMQWRNPETRLSRALFAFAINPRDPVFSLPELADPATIQALEQRDAVLFDRRSRPEFGPQTVGTTTEVERRQVKIVGTYTLGGGFAADGTLIMSDQNFLRFFEPRQLDRIDLGLIRLQPGVDPDKMVQMIRDRLGNPEDDSLRNQRPNDVLVLTKEQVIQREQTYWVAATSIGFIFGLGVIVSFIVGTVIVYQILYTDIADHLPEYATLKAMGYRSRYLFGVVIQEAVLLAVMGYIPGFLFSTGLYELTTRATSGSLPMAMNFGRTVFVLLLTIAMCIVSGLISVRKVVTADPAEVFS
ncbi:FtsX-like permease family protein [Oscillatoria sp. FACHB-1407]|uniref:ABC transporter permease DevC n=1 Tax=Oscillatoria sp. FACHB-1407 TaxID=2692847 RepID=UPI00168640D3|nr:ABC transporter permease DevC [Oscillatoria sp. FACHB-1407]MBD2462889.1 FtsX-like permease family protein [Oscillatoria sp. FACHB-1407]